MKLRLSLLTSRANLVITELMVFIAIIGVGI